LMNWIGHCQRRILDVREKTVSSTTGNQGQWCKWRRRRIDESGQRHRGRVSSNGLSGTGSIGFVMLICGNFQLANERLRMKPAFGQRQCFFRGERLVLRSQPHPAHLLLWVVQPELRTVPKCCPRARPTSPNA
jgi:hypothetical protein